MSDTLLQVITWLALALAIAVVAVFLLSRHD
mgnify:CR=1 FL=1|jgi:hypothetical protein